MPRPANRQSDRISGSGAAGRGKRADRRGESLVPAGPVGQAGAGKDRPLWRGRSKNKNKNAINNGENRNGY